MGSLVFLGWILLTSNPTLKGGEKLPSIFEEAKGKILRFRFSVGDIYQVKKESIQKIEINGVSFTRKIRHFIYLEVIEKNPQKGYKMRGRFISFIEYPGKKIPSYEEEYFSEFYLTPRGIMEVEKKYYMPNLRHIPTFPKEKDPSLGNLSRGDTWEALGVELIKKSLIVTIPLKVEYEYRGKEKSYHKIRYHFQINHELKPIYGHKDVPTSAFGLGIGVLYWDEEKSIPSIITEEMNLILHYSLLRKTERFSIKSYSYYFKRSLKKEAWENFFKELKRKYPKIQISPQKESYRVSFLVTKNYLEILEEITQFLKKRKFYIVLEAYYPEYAKELESLGISPSSLAFKKGKEKEKIQLEIFPLD